MELSAVNKPPIWYWLVSVAALLWNGLGVNAYLQQAYNTRTYRTLYTPEQLMVLDKTPAWVTAAFAIAVFAGFLGCIGLLLRKKWSKTLFLVSFIALLVQMIHGVFMVKMYQLFTLPQNIMSFSIPVVAILLFYIAKKSEENGWLR